MYIGVRDIGDIGIKMEVWIMNIWAILREVRKLGDIKGGDEIR